MEKIYVFLPVHNRRETTERFIQCLKMQSYQNYHLVLIDDGSTDGTEEMVRSQIEPLTVIKGRGDWWWAGALQQGYEWLRSEARKPSDVVLIINDDTQFVCGLPVDQGKTGARIQDEMALHPSVENNLGQP